MQVEAAIEGEQMRVRILDYMEGRKVTNGELQSAMGVPKSRIDYFLKKLFNSRHIYRERLTGCSYLYGRTSAKYIPRDYTKKIEITIDEEADNELDKEDLVEIKPTVPHARVVRLLRNPIARPAPSKNRKSMYSGIQSGLSMFSME